MNKIYTLFIFSLLGIFIFSTNGFALEHGDKAPELNISDWVRGKPVKIYNNNNKIKVICFWATWSATTPDLMNVISREQNFFGKDEVIFAAISKENEKVVENTLRKFSNLNFSIGIDKKSSTYRKYMKNTSGVPRFFVIGENNKLLWKGGPFEFYRVVTKVLSGTFNYQKQQKIEKLRKKYRKAARYMNFDKQKAFANKILEIDPTDRQAIKTLIDNYLRNDNINKAMSFLKKKIKKAGANKFILRKLYLDGVSIVENLRSKKGNKHLKEITRNYYNTFKNDPISLNLLVIRILKNAPLAIIPLKNLHEMTTHSIKLQKKWSPDSKELGTYLQSLARIYYLGGKLKLAVRTQKAALEYLEQDSKQSAKLMLDYYNRCLGFKKDTLSKEDISNLL